MNYTVVLSRDMGVALIHSIMEIKSESVEGAEKTAIEVVSKTPFPSLGEGEEENEWEIVAVFEGWHRNVCSGGFHNPDEED